MAPKKIKQTFRTHQEVCHVWMSQSQELGRAGYFRFVNKTLYIYDKAVARIYGKKTVLINPNIVEDCRMREKITTAIPKGYKVFEVPSISPLYHQKNISSFLRKIKSSYKKFWKARQGKNNYAWYSEYRIKELKRYVRHFGLRMPSLAGIRLNTKKGHDEMQRYFDKDIDKIWDAAHEADKGRDVLLLKIPLLEKAWVKGETKSTRLVDTLSKNDFIPYIARPKFSKIRLRLTIDGTGIESSDGACVPVKSARVLWKAIKAGKPVHGMKVGYYTVTGLNGTLRIGCHEIQRKEVDRLAAVLGW